MQLARAYFHLQTSLFWLKNFKLSQTNRKRTFFRQSSPQTAETDIRIFISTRNFYSNSDSKHRLKPETAKVWWMIHWSMDVAKDSHILVGATIEKLFDSFIISVGIQNDDYFNAAPSFFFHGPPIPTIQHTNRACLWQSNATCRQYKKLYLPQRLVRWCEQCSRIYCTLYLWNHSNAFL